jgi:hypothetical protein
VVDFIHVGGAHYNVADFFIIGATPLFLMAVAYSGWRAASRPVTVKAAAPAMGNRPWLRVPMLALLGAGLVVVAVSLGATNNGRVSTAPSHVSTKDESHASSVVAI